MKFNVNKAELIDKLQKVTNIIGTRSTLPILSNVMIEAQGNSITLTTTDLEVRISTKVEAKIEREGKTTLFTKKTST